MEEEKNNFNGVKFRCDQTLFVVNSLPVGNFLGSAPNPPGGFQLCLKEFKPCDPQKGLTPPLQEKGEPHTLDVNGGTTNGLI